MQFDKQEHKEICLKLLAASNIPGTALEEAYEFKMVVLAAEIKHQDSGKDKIKNRI